jgi:hypothetical protein
VRAEFSTASPVRAVTEAMRRQTNTSVLPEADIVIKHSCCSLRVYIDWLLYLLLALLDPPKIVRKQQQLRIPNPKSKI